jgi:hypothetical protein
MFLLHVSCGSRPAVCARLMYDRSAFSSGNAVCSQAVTLGAITGLRRQVCASSPAIWPSGKRPSHRTGRPPHSCRPGSRSGRHAAAVETREGEAFERFAEGSALVTQKADRHLLAQCHRTGGGPPVDARPIPARTRSSPRACSAPRRRSHEAR